MIQTYQGEIAISRSAYNIAIPIGLLAAGILVSSGAIAASCVASPTDTDNGSTPAGAVTSLPLASIDDFTFAGGFSLPADQFGASSLNYAESVIATSGNSLFIVGHVHDDAVAEFIMPTLGSSTSVSSLPSAGTVYGESILMA